MDDLSGLKYLNQVGQLDLIGVDGFVCMACMMER